MKKKIPVHFSSGSSSSHDLPEHGLAWTKWGQEAPPLEAWCKMTLCLSLRPPDPHRTEHGDHGPHSETLQSCTEKKGAKMMKNGTSKQICTVRWFFILLVYCVLVGLLTESKMHFFWRGFLGIFFFLSVLKYYLAESLVKAKSFWLFAPSFFPRVLLFWINTLCMHASFFYYIKCIWKYVFVRKNIC